MALSGIHTYYIKEQETQGSNGKEKLKDLNILDGKENTSE